MDNLGTLLNSLVLFVTKIRFKLFAWAAINVSRGPIGVPFFSKYVLTLPYSISALISKSRISKGSKNCSKASRFFSGLELFVTP